MSIIVRVTLNEQSSLPSRSTRPTRSLNSYPSRLGQLRRPTHSIGGTLAWGMRVAVLCEREGRGSDIRAPS